jgi:hypothetical protein
MNDYLVIAVLLACFAYSNYNTNSLTGSIKQSCPLCASCPPDRICPPEKVSPDKKNIYNKIIESFPLYYSLMFYKQGDPNLARDEYNKFFETNPEYSEYKFNDGENENDNKLGPKSILSKLILDTLSSKYIMERNKEIPKMTNQQLFLWIMERTKLVLSNSTKIPSEADVVVTCMKELEIIRPGISAQMKLKPI